MKKQKRINLTFFDSIISLPLTPRFSFILSYIYNLITTRRLGLGPDLSSVIFVSRTSVTPCGALRECIYINYDTPVAKIRQSF